MKSNVKRRMGHNIQQKEKKLATMRVICNLLFQYLKRKSWKFPTPCQKLACPLPLSEYLVEVKNLLKFSSTTKSSSKVVSDYFLPLFANFFPFAFKKNSGFFIFMSQLGNPNNKDIRDIPELAPPAMTRKLLWSAS